MDTVAVRLRVRSPDAVGIDQRLFALGQLRNAAVREARRRAAVMLGDERWRSHASIKNAKERSAAYRELRREFGVGETETREFACAHWKASRWMPDLLDRRAANALGREVWQSVESWLYDGFGRPRTAHPRERNMAWGNDLNGGLTLSPDVRKRQVEQLSELRVVWSTQAINRSIGRLGRKRLSLGLDWSCLTSKQRAHVLANLHTLRRVGIRRTVVRGEARYWALLCLDCEPYRSEEYRERLAARPTNAELGLDMGPTEQAWTTGENSGVIRLGEKALAGAGAAQARERRVKRALDRSRRANNPDCYDERGRVIRGRRPRATSKRGRRLAAESAEYQRKAAAQRRQSTIEQAREAALLAPVVCVEDQSLRSWQAGGYGARLLMTTPGAFLARLERELTLTGGRVERLPLRSAFSQYCICGTKVRKPRAQDYHSCENPACPIHGLRLHRHLFSAWLMRITSSSELGGIPALHEGTLATSLTQQYGGAPVLQESLRGLCGIRVRGRAKHSEGGRRRQRRASGSAAGRKLTRPSPPGPYPPRTAHAPARPDAPGNAALLDKRSPDAPPAYPR